MPKLPKSLLYRGWLVMLLAQTALPEPIVANPTDFPTKIQIQPVSSTASQATLLANDPRRSRRRTRGVAASRGDCQVARKNLPALLTIVPDVDDKPLPTTSARPTFWAYSPYKGNGDMRVEFVLYDRTHKDSSENPIFKQYIKPTGPGIFSITLPNTAPALKLGNVYEWFIKVYCDSDDILPASDSALVTLVSKTSSNKVIWYDRITVLANALRRNPDSSLKREWESLLKASGLEYLVEQPVLE